MIDGPILVRRVERNGGSTTKYGMAAAGKLVDENSWWVSFPKPLFFCPTESVKVQHISSPDALVETLSLLVSPGIQAGVALSAFSRYRICRSLELPAIWFDMPKFCKFANVALDVLIFRSPG